MVEGVANERLNARASSRKCSKSGRPGATVAIGLRSDHHFVMASRMSSTSGVGSCPGRSVALRQQRLPKRLTSANLRVRRSPSSNRSEKCLEFGMSLIVGGLSECLTTTRLRPTNGEQGQLPRRAQAREFSRSHLMELCGLGVVVAQVMSPRLAASFARRRPCSKKSPESSSRLRVTTTNAHH